MRKPDVCQPTGSAELPMLDVYMPMMKSAAIIAAGRLGLFEALAPGSLELAELAGKIQSSAQGTARLLDFLVSIGYLEKQGERFANTVSTQRWFTSVGQVDYTPGLLWTHEAWPMMGDLADAVRRGQPEKTLWNAMCEKPQLGEVFSGYMAAFAADLGPDLLEHVPVAANQQRLLDLGGSHGLHSIRFCQRYPQLSARIVDLPSALTQTPATIAEAGLSERIQLSPGNLLDAVGGEDDAARADGANKAEGAGDWGKEHDLVFYLSVAHNQTAADNRRVIARIAQALRPGGLLVIHEYLEETPLNAFDAAFRLTLLFETGTKTHRFEDYSEWLSAAGFGAVRRIDLNPREKGSLLLARR